MLLDECIQLLNAVRELSREIVLLPDVVLEMEELVAVFAVFAAVEDADKFPVAAMNADRWGQLIGNARRVRKVRENGLAIQRLALQCRDDADSIELLIRLSLDRQHLQQRRIEVAALNDGVTPGTGFDRPAPGCCTLNAGIQHHSMELPP